MTRLRRKLDAALKVQVVLEAIRGKEDDNRDSIGVWRSS